MKYYATVIGVNTSASELIITYQIVVLSPAIQDQLISYDEDGDPQSTVTVVREFTIGFDARLGEWLELLKDDVQVWLDTFSNKTPYMTLVRDEDIICPAWSDPKFTASIQRTVTLYSGDRSLAVVPLADSKYVVQTNTLRVVDLRHSSFSTVQMTYKQSRAGAGNFAYVLCAWLDDDTRDIIGTSPTWVSQRMKVTTAGTVTSSLFTLPNAIASADWAVFGVAVVRNGTPSSISSNAGQYAQIIITLTR